MNVLGISLIIGVFSIIVIFYLFQQLINYRKVLDRYKNVVKDLEGEVKSLEEKLDRITKPEK